MTDRIPKVALIAAAMLMVPLLAYVAYSRPAYFTAPAILGGIILLEFLLVAAWMYRRIFLPIVLLAFLLAGVDLPVGGVWTVARWAFLCIGAMVGCFIMLKERGYHFEIFHAVAIFCVIAAIVSSAVSHYPGFALLKAASFCLLFVYAGTGARLAASGRENHFLGGLLLGCEIFVGVLGILYFSGIEAMGNPNSLGAVMGVFGAPILLWGTLVENNPIVRHRRMALFALASYLVFSSRSRAGLLAAFVSCGLLCLALRKYKLFGQGMVMLLILITASAIFYPDAFSKTLSNLTSSVVYKDKEEALGLLSSRESPWQNAMDSIRKHFWFGSGFGTTDNGQDASAHLAKFVTVEGVTSENGSSYLSVFTWVGMLGALPFAFLLCSLMGKIFRTCLWMLNTGSPFHPAVPLAMVLVAGLIDAFFEDWLFAPGYYLCVFFWTMAFIFIDYTPWAPMPSFSHSRQPLVMAQGVSGMAPGR